MQSDVIYVVHVCGSSVPMSCLYVNDVCIVWRVCMFACMHVMHVCNAMNECMSCMQCSVCMYICMYVMYGMYVMYVI